MLRNYLLITLRNLQRNIIHSAIILTSLGLGIASCLVIYLFVNDELKFDSFHTKGQNIYRLVGHQRIGSGSFTKVGLTGSPFGPGMQAGFPEIASYTRVEEFSHEPLRVGDKQLFLEKKILWTDSTFFEIFDFELLLGDRSTLLDEPYNIVLTHSAALKFFDDASEALGKQIIIGDGNNPYVVTGIAEDVPEHSHIQFDALVSMVTYTRKHPEYNTDWVNNGLTTYFLMSPNVDIKHLESKFPAWLIEWTEAKDVNDGFRMSLQGLEDVHLGSTTIEHDYINYRKFSRQYLDIVAAIGIFILVIASINFMNLTTARAAFRWKEIGVRKSIGAQRTQLFRQFITESVLLALVSLLFAFTADLLFIPLLGQSIGRSFQMADLMTLPNVLMMMLAAITLGVVAAFYPSIYMSSVNTIKALKGRNIKSGKPVFQSTLVVVQFALAIGLIIGTLVVSKQIDFMKNNDLGFNRERIILVSMNDQANDKFDFLKSEIQKISSVTGVTASSQRIGNNIHQTVFSARDSKEVHSVFASNLNVDYDYFDVYQIPLRDGRAFSRNFPTDKGNAFIINKAMMKELEVKDPVGMAAGYNEETNGAIVGVVDDFKYNSLHHKVSALSISCHSSWKFSEMSVKIRANSEQKAIGSIRDVWSRVVIDFPFEYYFLEDHFEDLYKNDSQLNSAVSILTVISILISCIGLFGLAALSTVQKTKEIGIRKILGASEMQILSLLSKNFVLLIGVAFVLIVPVSYFLTSWWLQNFAYRIPVDPLVFVVGGILALIAGFLTISYHTLRTARTNPVETLKHE